MATYSFPTAAEIMAVEQVKLPRLLAARPVFDILPIRTQNSDIIIWEQKDNYTGLQQLRGYNGEPPKVAHVGAKRYTEMPGVYGEFIVLDELMLTQRRATGTFAMPISIDDLVMEAQDQLLGRRLDRIEQIIWTLLTTGTFSVSLLNGAVGHSGTYTLQTYSASDWSVVATGTPLTDFRAVQLLGRGRSGQFGSRATAFLNRVTANSLLANTNAADLGGKRTSGLANILSMHDVNGVLLGEDLPTLVIYDEGYLNDAGTFVPFIANDKVVVVAARPSGVAPGAYVMTRNANNPALTPGAYTKTIDRTGDQVPPIIEVHDGHNGGPILEYPGDIVVMSV